MICCCLKPSAGKGFSNNSNNATALHTSFFVGVGGVFVAINEFI